MIEELQIDCVREAERIVSSIRDSVLQRRAEGVVLGLSGGVDSALAAALCVRALSPEKVVALHLPERDSDPGSSADARLVATRLGIEFRLEDLSRALEALGCYRSGASGVVRLRGLMRAAVRLFPRAVRRGYLASLEGAGGNAMRAFYAFYRMKHRLRFVRCCREAEERNLLVVSCANRTEHEIGFFVRYGDDAGDIAPIRHLYKSQVFALGEHVGLPERLLEKKPSPDLFAGVADEEILGMPFEVLDGILCLVDRGADDGSIAARLAVDANTIGYVRDIAARSRWMREGPRMSGGAEFP